MCRTVLTAALAVAAAAVTVSGAAPEAKPSTPPAADATVKVTTTEITFKSGDEEIKGVLNIPDGAGPFPGIVVIHEWWGLTDWPRDNAKRLASHGYVTLAVDLYRGKTTDDRAEAGMLRRGLPADRALRDLKAAVDTLAAHKSVNKDYLGSIGWCMGGQLSLQLAIADDRIKACTVCYGALPSKPDDLKTLKASVLGIFGEADMGIPPKAVHAFEAAMKEAGKFVHAAKIYPGAGHGFMRQHNSPAWNEAFAKDAWTQIDAYFAKTLGGK